MKAKAHVLKLSPITRLNASFDLELGIDREGKLLKLKEKFVERLNVAEQKRDSILKSVVILDGILAILISGKALNIPYLNIGTTDLPAILEIVTALSAISSVFFAAAFINWAAYNAIVNQYSVIEARTSGIDPDFIDAAERHTELMLKIFRPKFNIWGVDFHHPGKGFIFFSGLLTAMFGSLFILFPILHYIIVLTSFSITLSSPDVGYVSYLYIAIMVLCNILAAMVFVGAYKNFDFMVKLTDESEPIRDGASTHQ